MEDLPEQFLKKMQVLLGSEYAAFRNIYSEPPQAGLRVNTLKIPVDAFFKSAPFSLRPLAWARAGFLLEKGESGVQPGKHPYHAAGLYYLQDPSAMAAVEVLSPQPGEVILDLAAAPGGKATQIASMLQNQGLLVANEVHPQRIWDLVENLERWGAHNVVITNDTPQNLANHFGAFFDRVLVDAPCSGEGMFRKSASARRDWSPTLVQACATRQYNILQQASRMVKPGGYLVYTTCTFSPEENEGVIFRFLNEMASASGPVFELVSIPATHFSPGVSEWIECTGQNGKRYVAPGILSRAVRLYPHRGAPEGHFIALLQRVDDGRQNRLPTIRRRAPEQDCRLLERFFVENLTVTPERLHLEGSYWYQMADCVPELGGLRVKHPGWWLGSAKAGRFEPSHALAMALFPEDFRRRLIFEPESDDVIRYLKGQELDSSGEPGWLVIAVRFDQTDMAFTLGWGKRLGARVKNDYPRGLRWM